MNEQIEHINQELKQYLWFFVDYKQKDWLEWLAIAEFAVNNKVHTATKVSLFIENYNRELRMGVDIRKKEKATKFVERIKKIQKGVEVALKKAQKEIKIQVNTRKDQ